MQAIDTSTVIDSEDFSEDEWILQKKKFRRDNTRKTFDNKSSNESEESTMNHNLNTSKDICHQEKKKKGRISRVKVKIYCNCYRCPSHP